MANEWKYEITTQVLHSSPSGNFNRNHILAIFQYFHLVAISREIKFPFHGMGAQCCNSLIFMNIYQIINGKNTIAC